MTKPDPQIHFLVGMSRAAISWLSRALNQHPEIAVFGQSRFWGKHYLEPNKDGLYTHYHRERLIQKARCFEWDATVGAESGCFPDTSLQDFQDILSDAIYRCDYPAQPRSVFAAMASAVAQIKSATIVIEKTPHHALHVDRIAKSFPEAKFILLWCDAENHLSVLKSQKDLIFHPAAASLVWRRYNEAILEFRASRQGKGIFTCYSELQNHPLSTVSDILSQLEVQPFQIEKCIPKFFHGREPGGTLPQLTAADYFWLHRMAGVRTSQANTNPSREAFSIIQSFATLASFGVRHLRENPSDVEGSLLDYYCGWMGKGRVKS